MLMYFSRTMRSSSKLMLSILEPAVALSLAPDLLTGQPLCECFGSFPGCHFAASPHAALGPALPGGPWPPKGLCGAGAPAQPLAVVFLVLSRLCAIRSRKTRCVDLGCRYVHVTACAGQALTVSVCQSSKVCWSARQQMSQVLVWQAVVSRKTLGVQVCVAHCEMVHVSTCLQPAYEVSVICCAAYLLESCCCLR